jgi:hypothetical protein
MGPGEAIPPNQLVQQAFALALARSVAEGLAKGMLRGMGIKPPDMLNACIRKLEEPDAISRGFVQKVIIATLDKVMAFGNKAVHGDLPIVVTTDHVYSVAGDVLLVAQWYFGEFKPGRALCRASHAPAAAD